MGDHVIHVQEVKVRRIMRVSVTLEVLKRLYSYGYGM